MPSLIVAFGQRTFRAACLPMPGPAQPEFLPPLPAWRGRLARLFCDRNLDLLAHFLDECFRVPGTSMRFGVDGVIGIIPGLGDILAGLASCVLIFAAWVRGLPYVALVRMTANVGIAVLIGAVPFLGDVFDIAWKANRRNYRLLTRHLRQPRRHTWKDWAFLGGLGAVIVALLAAPLLVLVALVLWLEHRWRMGYAS